MAQQRDGMDILFDAMGEGCKLATEKFREHPATNGETYIQHFLFAFTASIATLLGGLMLMVHAVFPFFMSNSAGSLVVEVSDRVQAKRAKQTTIEEEETA